MRNLRHALWVEKYRPFQIKNYIFYNTQQKDSIMEMLSNKTIPHLLFSGSAGTGKTTLSQVIVNELEMDEFDVLTINASDENSVDVIRDKIKTFISTYGMNEFKIVVLEEADYLTPNAQAVLRRMMEEYANYARFILNCNYENKIIPSIKSRTQHFHFKNADRDDIAEFVLNILASEEIKFNIDLLDKYISIGYPDIRKIVNLVQQHSINGQLQEPKDETGSSDYKFELLDHLNAGNWTNARTLVCQNISGEEWEELFTFLYQNLNKVSNLKDVDKWEAGIVIIADHLAKHSLVADPEINVAAMFIRLSQI